jgi:hypothetical protein
MVLASARRSAWRVATQRVAPAVLNRALAYYNFDMENRRNFMNAYARYMTALNNTTAVAARRNAQAAATKFVNTMFKEGKNTKLGNAEGMQIITINHATYRRSRIHLSA